MIPVAFVSNSARGELTGRFPWAVRMRDYGFAVDFFLPPGEEAFTLRMNQGGVATPAYPLNRGRLNPASEIRAISTLAQRLRAGRYEIVHSFGHRANLCATLAGAAARIPITFNHITGLGSVFTSVRPTRREKWLRHGVRAAYRLNHRLVDAFFFQNGDDAVAFEFLPAARRILTPGTGVDLQRFSRDQVDPSALVELRHELRLDDDALVLTYVGRLLQDKGINELLAAVRRLQPRFPHLVLLVVGPTDTPNPSCLSEDDLRGTLGDRVRPLGRREDVRELLALTDIFVNPSYREGIPRTNLEAMAMKIPIVTTNAVGCRDTIEDGVTGRCVEVRDAVALERGLEELLVSAHKRRAMGEAGRRKVESQFSLDRVLAQIAAVYDDAIDRSQRSRAMHA